MNEKGKQIFQIEFENHTSTAFADQEYLLHITTENHCKTHRCKQFLIKIEVHQV